MSNCENNECPYCATHDEDREEYCWFYDMPCYQVEKCKVEDSRIE